MIGYEFKLVGYTTCVCACVTALMFVRFLAPSLVCYRFCFFLLVFFCVLFTEKNSFFSVVRVQLCGAYFASFTQYNSKN